MSIQPIDLQTLLLRLNQVGQEQSAERHAIAQNQAVTGSEIAEKSQEQERRLDQASTIEEGPEKVKDQEGQTQEQLTEERERESKGEQEEKSDLFRDPDLGQNVDISG
jgi:hypothetical protein